MKQPFNNPGVAQKQADFFSLTKAEQAMEIQAMLNDFAAWMEENFLLSPYQEEQIASMPEDFKAMLSTSIAECWESNQPVRFNKETRATDDRSPKDIIIGKGVSTEADASAALSSAGTGLYILIRYRPLI